MERFEGPAASIYRQYTSVVDCAIVLEYRGNLDLAKALLTTVMIMEPTMPPWNASELYS